MSRWHCASDPPQLLDSKLSFAPKRLQHRSAPAPPRQGIGPIVCQISTAPTDWEALRRRLGKGAGGDGGYMHGSQVYIHTPILWVGVTTKLDTVPHPRGSTYMHGAVVQLRTRTTTFFLSFSPSLSSPLFLGGGIVLIQVAGFLERLAQGPPAFSGWYYHYSAKALRTYYIHYVHGMDAAATVVGTQRFLKP